MPTLITFLLLTLTFSWCLYSFVHFWPKRKPNSRHIATWIPCRPLNHTNLNSIKKTRQQHLRFRMTNRYDLYIFVIISNNDDQDAEGIRLSWKISNFQSSSWNILLDVDKVTIRQCPTMSLNILDYLLADFIEVRGRYANISDLLLIQFAQLFYINQLIRSSLDILGMAWVLGLGLTTIF